MEKIKIAIVGLGNCASSLIQGLYYYEDKNEEDVDGLMHWSIDGYKPSDIEVVAATDIDKRKVGKDVSEAIFAKPNCTTVFCPDIKEMGVKVSMGQVLDGVAPHMKNYKEDSTFVISVSIHSNDNATDLSLFSDQKSPRIISPSFTSSRFTIISGLRNVVAHTFTEAGDSKLSLRADTLKQ